MKWAWPTITFRSAGFWIATVSISPLPRCLPDRLGDVELAGHGAVASGGGEGLQPLPVVGEPRGHEPVHALGGVAAVRGSPSGGAAGEELDPLVDALHGPD